MESARVAHMGSSGAAATTSSDCTRLPVASTAPQKPALGLFPHALRHLPVLPQRAPHHRLHAAPGAFVQLVQGHQPVLNLPAGEGLLGGPEDTQDRADALAVAEPLALV